MSQTISKVFSPMPAEAAGLVLPSKEHDEARQGAAYGAPSATATGIGTGKRAFIETYGCQMNFSDTEIIASTLRGLGYGFTKNEAEADVVLLNTCAIRDNAEQKVWHRLDALKGLKRRRPGLVVGLMGCMAERLKAKLLDEAQMVDLVVGPDAYRALPALLAEVESGQRAVNVLLSREETYADIAPVRLGSNGVSAFISIMRGCDNMCAFCVVPFTRGRERSRDAASIVAEARELAAQGYREVTLLGQNVDSYAHEGVSFAALLARVAQVHPALRVRFSTSHPKDINDEVLHVMAAFPNICKYIHLPVQSGSSAVLERMNRGYTREWYLEKIARIRALLPGCALSTDIITGFCGETEAEHQETLSLMAAVQYDFAYMFAYSERPGTLAARKMADDVAEETKARRLREVIELQGEAGKRAHAAWVGREALVLIEGDSKRSAAHFAGRADDNKMVVFPKNNVAHLGPGAYVRVQIEAATAATLLGTAVAEGASGLAALPVATDSTPAPAALPA